ncbi:MAG: cyclic nucleotide-binding domain-containing protein [Gammaproteobacteria bacterium]|nr:cyclic nucleotide-binding domain-containing protein [Gammaproteobacteria bacterium]
MSAMVALDDQYGAVIRSLVPINGLAQKYQQQVLAQAEALTFDRGQFVFREGDRDAYAFYLLDGELDLISKGSLVKHVKGGSDDATHALAQLQPRQLSARASGRISVLRLERKVLDRFLVLDGGTESAESVEVSEIDSGEDGDWMTRMLQSELFSRVPAANIQRIFTKMEHIEAKAGDEVVHQGAPGDYYYVIQAGRAEVVRTTAQGRQSVRLAELAAGDSFGEEALVSNSRRNASIVMLTDGELMRLTKEDFIELIKDPLLTDVDYERAQEMVADGAVWLDVRFNDEFGKESLPDSINIPLNVLRLQSDKLAPDRRYICCCDSGTRSSVAAFLLAERGFDACYLSGGLLEYSLIEGMGPPAEPAAPVAVADKPAPEPAPEPELDLEIDDSVGDVVTFPPNTQSAAPIPASQQSEAERTLSGVRVRHEEAADSGDSMLQADVKAQALAAEFAKASMQLEEARKIKLEAEAASEAAAESAKRTLAQERKRFEEVLQKQRAAEAEKARRDAEAAATKQLEIERRKLAEAAEKSRQEQAQAARSAAEKMLEERLEAERQKLQAQAREAEDTWNEARRLKEELEEAKLAAQEEADQRHREQEERIQRMQREAEERLREEEARLEKSYAWQAEELARLQKLKEEAEVELNARRSQLEVESEEAQQRLAEARRIQHEVEQTREDAAREAEERHKRQIELERKLREEVQEKMQSERRKLEAEFARNAEELDRARREREAAEAARIAAAEEAERIVAEYRTSHSAVREQEEARLAAERARLEAEAKQIDQAREEAGSVREEALRMQREAEDQVKELMALRAQLTEQRKNDAADQLVSELRAAEEDISTARANVEAAEAAQRAADAAHETNVENMERQVSEESSVKARFEQEIAEWITTQDVEENSAAQQQILANQREHLERIKRRAQAAREAAKNHDQSLIDELSQQLRKEITD